MTPEEMAALHRRCFTTPKPWSAEDFAAHLTDSLNLFCFNPYGFAIGRVVADEAELLTVAIDPDHRRRGHGAQLLKEYELGAAQRGARTSFLEVSADNAEAIGLYRSAGYEQAGERREYYRRPDGSRCDAIVLRKELSGRTVPETPESS